MSSPHHVTVLRPALDPPLPRQWCPALRPPPLCYLSSASHSPACRQVTVGLSPRRQLEPLWPLLVLERRARTTRRSGLNRCPTTWCALARGMCPQPLASSPHAYRSRCVRPEPQPTSLLGIHIESTSNERPLESRVGNKTKPLPPSSAARRVHRMRLRLQSPSPSSHHRRHTNRKIQFSSSHSSSNNTKGDEA